MIDQQGDASEKKNMLQKISLLPLVLCIAMAGCNAEKQDGQNIAKAAVNSKPAQDDDAPDEAEAGLIEQTWNQIRDTSSSAASGVTNTVNDLYEGAVEGGSEATDATVDFVTGLYNKAKETGETTTASARDWVMDDLKKGGAWEYRVVQTTAAEAEALEAEMNKLGEQRWECYSVVPGNNGDVTIFLKRPARSMIRSLPARDLLRLVPLLGGGDDGGE